METLYIYFGKMIIVSAVMFAYYLVFLRDKTFHHYNRFYLLAIMVLGLLLPLLKVEYFTIETDSRFLLLLNQFNQNSPKVVENSFSFWNLGALALAIISVFLLAKLTLGLLKIHQLKKEFPKEKIEGITFYNTNLQDAPFSFFRNLFWKKSILLQSDLGRQILKHEMVHIEQKHSIDKLFIQIIQSVFWFNPIFYFIKKEINLIHEYLADKKTVKQSDTRAFAQMLLASNFSGNTLPATSPFLSSNLKKRLKMITIQKTKFSYARRILALPILFMVSFALLVNAKNTEIRKQNKAIATAVQELKKDTIKQNDLQKMLQSNQEKLTKASEKIKKETEKIATLSEESRKKSEELQKIAKEKGNTSYEFELKAKELDQLGKELDKVAQSDHFKKNMKILEWSLKDMGELFDSKDFKGKFNFDVEKLKELEKLGKLKVLTHDKMFEKADELSDFPVELKGFNYHFENYDKNNSNDKLSKDQQKKLEKLTKERKELAEKQAELAKKQRELMKQQAEITGAKGNPWIIGVDAFPKNSKTIIIKSDKLHPMKWDEKDERNVSEHAKIYINGKLSTKAEMEKIKPEDIATVNVNKNVNNGVEEGEIRIETKK